MTLLNRELLENAQVAIALRLSTHPPGEGTWTEWARALEGRLKAVEMYAAEGERPSYGAALCLAADAAALLVAVEASEVADIASGEAA